MNETTRRGLVASAAAIFSVGVASQLLDSDHGSDDATRLDDQVETHSDIPGASVYVGESFLSLPDSPDGTAFGITGDGIYWLGDSDATWQHIQYGSTENPVPTLTAASASVGTTPASRPLISNDNRTIYVDPDGGDDSGPGTEEAPVATIQEAVERVPIYLRNQFTIDLATVPETPVTYDEDVLVPTVIGTGRAGQEADAPRPGPFINLVLRGDDRNAGAVRIGSLMFGNVVGTAVGNLEYSTILRESPYDDEKYGVAAYGDGEVKLIDVQFESGPTNGILAYGARMKATRIDFGRRNVEVGFKAKRHGSIIVHDSTGAARSDGYRASGNSIITVRETNSLTGNPLLNTLRGGLIYHEASGSWNGIETTRTADAGSGDRPTERTDVCRCSDHPDDAARGEIWYVDGSGDADEGFYGQTEDGPAKIS